jgi:hypothetical protein
MKPKADFSKAAADFAKTMREYQRLSKREAADALNKKAKDVAIRTISRTPKADKGAIEASLRGPGRGGGTLVYRLFQHKGMTRMMADDQAKRFIKARQASIAYIRAGWYKAAQMFGARGGRVRPGGLAEKGSGTKATPGNLTAILENKTVGAEKISGPALSKAMDEVRKDMLVYIARKLREGWGKKQRR